MSVVLEYIMDEIIKQTPECYYVDHWITRWCKRIGRAHKVVGTILFRKDEYVDLQIYNVDCGTSMLESTSVCIPFSDPDLIDKVVKIIKETEGI